MALVTTTVTGDLTYVDNTELDGATVIFTLSGDTFDKVSREAVLPVEASQSAPTNAQGQFTIDVWPTERGRDAVTYTVTVTPAGASKPVFTRTNVQVPVSATSMDLADLVMTKPVANKQVVILTQAELTAALESNPDYLTGKLVYVQEPA